MLMDSLAFPWRGQILDLPTAESAGRGTPKQKKRQQSPTLDGPDSVEDK
jgi:hypothetical protein